MVILATNLKANIDDAFARRFQSVVYFPMPDQEMRYRLWQNTLKDRFDPSHPSVLEEVAAKYELSGGAIINVVRYCAIRVLQENRQTISKEDLVAGIVKELRKEGRTL